MGMSVRTVSGSGCRRRVINEADDVICGDDVIDDIGVYDFTTIQTRCMRNGLNVSMFIPAHISFFLDISLELLHGTSHARSN